MKFGRNLEQHLSNPQHLNSYAYAAGNPIKYRDPNGEILPIIAAAFTVYGIVSTAIDLYYGVGDVISYPDSFTPREKEERYVKAGFDILTLGIGNVDFLTPTPVFDYAYNLLGVAVDSVGLYKDSTRNQPSQSNQPSQQNINKPNTSQSSNSNSRTSTPAGTNTNHSSAPSGPTYQQQLLDLQQQLDVLKAQVQALEAQQANARK
jgi:hypothetical protein